jgi:chromosome segregation ATPase
MLEQAKVDRASLLESLEEAKAHLQQADINRKALTQEYREYQHQRDAYRDQEARARQRLQNRRGNDGRDEAQAAQQAAQKAVQERRVAEKKVNDLAVKLQLANVKYSDTTSQLERASEMIASLRSECAAAKKERDEFEKQIRRHTTASTRAALVDRENAPCF